MYTTNTLRLCVVVPSRDEFNSVVKRAKDTSNHIVSHLRKESTIVLDGSDLDVGFRSFKAVYGNRTLDEVLNGAAPRRPLALRPHQSLALAETAAIRATGARNASWGQIPRSGKGYIMAAFIAADARGKTNCNYIIITTAPNETLDQYETILRCADLDGFNVLRLPRNSVADLGAKNIVICSKQYLQSKFDETPAPAPTESAAIAAELTETGIAKPDIKKGGKGKGRAKKAAGRRGTPPITQYFNRTPPPVVVAPALAWLAALRFDARFIDESHLGGATDLARQMLSCFGADAFTVFVTATYAKPVHTYGIPATRQVIWDLADVAAAKRFTDPSARALIFAKHPLAEPVFDGIGLSRVAEIYSEYPELTILTRELTPETIAALRDAPNDAGAGKYGWSPKSCLLLKQSAVADQSGRKGKGKVAHELEFQNKTETIKMLRDVFGPPRDQFGRLTVAGYDDNFIERARNVCNNGAADSRFMLDPGCNVDPTVVMMFLPSNNVDTTSIALKALIDSENALPEYGICIINSKHAGDPKQTIVEARAIAKRDGKRALLVLSGRQCSLGVTIPGCDIVVLMNGGGVGGGAGEEDDDAASDMVYQMMFRGMTEAPGKRFGFVIDMDIRRSLRAVMANQCAPVAPAASGNRATIRQTISVLLRERTVSLNPDQWEPRFRGGAGATEAEALALAAERYAARVYDAYTAHKGRLLGELIATLGFKSDMFARNNCAFLRALVTPTRGAVSRAKALVARAADVPDGIEKVAVESGAPCAPDDADANATEAVDEPDEDKEPTAEEMVRHLVPILSFLTIHETTSSVRHMMDLIKSDPEMMEVLLDRTRAWWGDKGSAENVDTLVAVYEIHMACDARQVATVDMVKDLFVQNIDNAAELSRLIDQHLVPLESEKKANAEVSTPAPLRADMLDRIPPEFWTSVKHVLEPCAGKGGFLVDMMGRFMVGLAPTIPDPVERRRVIVEECLYWADINPFNVRVCRILLDPFGRYKTKGYLGDSLALDPMAQWGIPAFDAVVGNPPYQTDPSRSGNIPLYNLFIEHYITASRYLLFVVPSRWFASTRLSAFRARMLARKDIVLIEHTEDASTWFGRNVNISGGVNYFLKDSMHSGLCIYNGVQYDLAKYDCMVNTSSIGIVDACMILPSVADIFVVGDFFGVETNDSRLCDAGRVKCFVSANKAAGRIKYIADEKFAVREAFWKVVTAEANGNSPRFGAMFIGAPDEVYTGSYRSFRVDSLQQAESLVSYLQTKFANYMLSIRKISQHINKDTCRWIPMVPLDRVWTDDAVCAHLGIDRTLYP